MFGHPDFQKLDELRGKIPITEVVSGGAAGADSDGEIWACELNIPVRRFAADWDKHGKAAGPIRNAEMADYAEALIAFPGGKGTANMVKQAKKKGLKIWDWRDG